jgi:hypothetical protein
LRRDQAKSMRNVAHFDESAIEVFEVYGKAALKLIEA